MSGFRLYFAGCGTTILPIDLGENCGRLFTFADGAKGVDKRIEMFGGRVFVDSGAYSIARSGRKVTIDDYIEYINRTDSPEVFASLDAIPFPELNAQTAKECSEKSWENYLYMVENVKEEAKDKILPVYHFGEPIEYLHKILDSEVNGHPIHYMGLGGGNAGRFSRNVNYYTNVFNIIKKSKNPNIKVHAFGMTVLKLLEMFPFYSADSTTWLITAANGSIIMDNGSLLSVSDRSKHLSENFWNLGDHAQEVLRNQIEAKGFKVEELAVDYKQRQMFNISYFRNWADNYKFKGYNHNRRRLF